MRSISSEIIFFYRTDYPENQPAGLQLASEIQGSRMKWRREGSQSRLEWRPNPEIAQHTERSDTQ